MRITKSKYNTIKRYRSTNTSIRDIARIMFPYKYDNNKDSLCKEINNICKNTNYIPVWKRELR